MHRSEMKTLVALLMLLLVLATALPVWAGAEGGSQQLPAGVSGDWWTQAQAYIRQAEYQPSPVTDAAAPDQLTTVQAPNRAHNFRTFFSPEGVRVVPRTADDADWTWGLSLVALGAPDDLRRPEPARVQLKGNRIELVRGTLTEWYRNDQRGLEQGFTLHAPPPGGTGAAELVLRLAVHGTLVGSLDHDGATLAFVARNGKPMLQFGHLLALDATGRELPARFRLGDGNLDITVATTAAQYPLLIDPLATSPDWTAESNQAGAELGYSVGTAGDVNGDGHADVIIGAPQYDHGLVNEGRAFVFHGSAAGLSPTPNWMAESNQTNARFGHAVATAGDIDNDGYDDVIVGAPYYDHGQENEGAIFVYFGAADGLDLISVQRREIDRAGAQLGFSVSTAGDVNGDGFADVIAGAPYYANPEEEEGAAVVYLGSVTGLSAADTWRRESNQIRAHAGHSVATAGDVNGDGYADVLVGVPHWDHGHVDEGAVAVYLGSAFGLSPFENWTAESDQANAIFGFSVATAGDVNNDGFADVIVGAPGYDNPQGISGGAVAVYFGSATGLKLGTAQVRASDGVETYFGYSVAAAGDVNNDGFADVIVGAPFYDNGQTDEGKASVYFGSRSGLGLTPNWTVESDQFSARFGYSVGGAGDVNGDGFDDVIVGAIGHTHDLLNEGGAFVYHGSGGSFFVIPTPSGQATIIYLE